jgi:hypothetical protein
MDLKEMKLKFIKIAKKKGYTYRIDKITFISNEGNHFRLNGFTDTNLRVFEEGIGHYEIPLKEEEDGEVPEQNT